MKRTGIIIFASIFGVFFLPLTYYCISNFPDRTMKVKMYEVHLQSFSARNVCTNVPYLLSTANNGTDLLTALLSPAIGARCDLLYRNNTEEQTRVRRTLDGWNLTVTNEQFVRTLLLQNCSFKKIVFNSGFFVSEEEYSFPLAFSILVYARGPGDIQQYIRLIRVLYRPQNVFCVHIDQDSPDWWIHGLEDFASCFDNILIARNAVKVNYDGDGSILQAHIACLNELNNRTDLEWQYVIQLHGTEIPLMTNKEIVHALKPLNGSIAAEKGNLLSGYPHDSIFFRKVYYKGINRPNKDTPTVTVPYDLPIYKSAAAALGAFSREYVSFALTDPRAIALSQYLWNVKSAEEMYFSSVAFIPDNPAGWRAYQSRDTQPRIPKVFSCVWNPKYNYERTNLCAEGYYIHRLCIASASDLPRLKWASEHKSFFFFNKYLISYDHVVMDCIERLLLQRNLEEYQHDCM